MADPPAARRIGAPDTLARREAVAIVQAALERAVQTGRESLADALRTALANTSSGERISFDTYDELRRLARTPGFVGPLILTARGVKVFHIHIAKPLDLEYCLLNWAASGCNLQALAEALEAAGRDIPAKPLNRILRHVVYVGSPSATSLVLGWQRHELHGMTAVLDYACAVFQQRPLRRTGEVVALLLGEFEALGGDVASPPGARAAKIADRMSSAILIKGAALG